MAPQRFFAGGKINLFLKTERLRADGFHDISTLFLPFSRPADILTVEWEAPLGIHVTASSPDVPEGKDNLVYRAAMRYAEAAGIAPNWSIHIEKHLPVAAGVGGGSADAGCILAALEKRYTRLGGDALFKIAASLGSDVPFFLAGEPRAASGRGEILRPVEKFPFPPIVLVFPGFPVTAKWAYAQITPELRRGAAADAADKLAGALAARDYARAAAMLHNDLEYALFDKFPLLEILRSGLLASGALRVVVSGSGSSLFALMPNHETAERAAAGFDGKDGCRAWHLGGGK